MASSTWPKALVTLYPAESSWPHAPASVRIDETKTTFFTPAALARVGVRGRVRVGVRTRARGLG